MKGNQAVYQYLNSDMHTFKDALEKSIKHSLEINGLYSTLEKYCSIGDTPFLIYGEPADRGKIEYVNFPLLEYNSRPFATLSDALLEACKDFTARYPDKDVVEAFYPIYEKQKNGRPLFARTSDKIFQQKPELIEIYRPTTFSDLLVRKRVDWGKLRSINEILGDVYSIRRVGSDCFYKMLSDIKPQFKLKCDSKDYINIAGTKLFWRKGCEEYLNDICIVSNISRPEVVSDDDKSLLLKIYKSYDLDCLNK